MQRAGLGERLASGAALVLDGGLATSLEELGHDLSDALWSARLLRDEPDSIRALHADYLTAGADVIVTASYQASTAGFSAVGVDAAEARALLQRSVQLGREARDATRPSALVAASIGPYGAAQADGSEYTGRYDTHIDSTALYEFHAPRLDALLEAGPDALACETIPNASEARVLAQLVAERGPTPAWLSLSCPAGAPTLADGTPLAEILPELCGLAPWAALGVNCTAPGNVDGLLEVFARSGAGPFLAYPNSGEGWDPVARSWRGERDAVDFAAAASSWLTHGARAVGGCCRTGPTHVRALRELVDASRA